MRYRFRGGHGAEPDRFASAACPSTPPLHPSIIPQIPRRFKPQGAAMPVALLITITALACLWVALVAVFWRIR